jgi:hypothetical protein
VNNFVSYDTFVSFYNLDFSESQSLLIAVEKMRKDGRDGTWMELDYYYNVVNNKNYTKLDAIF